MIRRTRPNASGLQQRDQQTTRRGAEEAVAPTRRVDPSSQQHQASIEIRGGPPCTVSRYSSLEKPVSDVVSNSSRESMLIRLRNCWVICCSTEVTPSHVRLW